MTKTKTTAATTTAGSAENRRLKKKSTQVAYRARQKKAKAEPEANAAAKTKRKARVKRTIQPKTGQSRADLCIGLLKRPRGATVAEIMEPTAWLPHTTRAFLSATIGKKLGHRIVTEKVEGRGRVYRIATEAEGEAA